MAVTHGHRLQKLVCAAASVPCNTGKRTSGAECHRHCICNLQGKKYATLHACTSLTQSQHGMRVLWLAMWQLSLHVVPPAAYGWAAGVS